MRGVPSKAAKRVEVKAIPVTSVVYAYTCPTCKTQHQNYSLSSDVLRIRCSHCKQELILGRAQ